jgi:uncharacterized repeat protein (TIGR01451 family)
MHYLNVLFKNKNHKQNMWMPIVLAVVLGLNQFAILSFNLPIAQAQDEVIVEETPGLLEQLGDFVENTLQTLNIVGSCELTLTKTDFDATASPDTDLAYRLVLKNTGTANCTGGGVKLRDYIPEHTTYVSSDVSLSFQGSYYVEWNFGTVEPNEEHTVNLLVHVDSDVPCDTTLMNKAKYWSTQTDWGPNDGAGTILYVREYTPIQCNVNPICGDGIVNQSNEQCDGTAGVGQNQSCSDDCQLLYCGDGEVNQAFEQCDDKNNVAGDGCSAICELEQDYCPVPVDVVMVIDRSGSMEDDSYCTNSAYTTKTPCLLNGFQWIVEPMNTNKSAAKYFVDRLDMTKDKVGLVSYATNVTLESSLTNDDNLIKNKIDALTPNGYTNIGGAMAGAKTELDNHNRTDAAPVIILLTDGKANVTASGTYPYETGGANYALAEATNAKDAGYIVYTIGLGTDVSHSLLTSMASDPTKYYPAPTTADLQNIYNQIASDICDYSSIGGCKYNDQNNNGVINDSEPTIPGWEITLSYQENSQDVVKTTTTNDNGCYTFAGLEPNTYTVAETMQNTWTQTYPTSTTHVLSIGYGATITDKHFANYQTPAGFCGDGIVNQSSEQCDDHNNVSNDGCSATCQIEYGTISGCKYKDLNNNGVIDSGEPTISQWPITLTNNILASPQAIATTTTDLNGCYEFTNLTFGGNYTVAEEQMPGWTQTYPAPTSTYVVQINSIAPYENKHFANYQTPGVECGNGIVETGEQCDDKNNVAGDGCSATCQIEYSTISGCKYSDQNNNGVINDSEPTIAGWPIVLHFLDSQTDPVQTTTGVNGCYEFTQVTYGTYNVSETVLAGWAQTYPTSTTYNVSITNPGNYSGYHFANYDEPEPPCTVNCGGGGGGPTNPILTIDKSANVSFTNPGGIVDYTIAVKNVGNSTGYNLKITDVLPSGLEYYGTTTSGIWQLGDIAVNETKTVTYQVLFSDSLVIGNYTNTAKAEITNGSPVQDTAVVEVRNTTVYSQEYAPILSIDKKVNMSFTNPGGEITYTVTITNTNAGNLTAENVNLVDRLPKEFYFNSNKIAVNSWALGNLAPGESKTVSYDVTVKTDTKNGTYENIAVASADNAPEVYDKVPLEIRDVKALGFTLPDTDGSLNHILSIILGLLILAAGYIGFQVKKEYQLV